MTMTLAAVSAVKSSARRRTSARRKSRTGQSCSASGWRCSRRRCSHMPSGMNSSPVMKTAGIATKTTRPAYGLRWNMPISSAIAKAMKATADTVAISAPITVSGCRRSALFVTNLLLEAGEVGDQRVEIGRRQAGVLRRHRRLLGRTALRRHPLRIDDPLLDVGGRQLGADPVERIGGLALAGDGVAHAAFLRGVDLFAVFDVLRGGGGDAGEGEGDGERRQRQQPPRERVQHR